MVWRSDWPRHRNGTAVVTGRCSPRWRPTAVWRARVVTVVVPVAMASREAKLREAQRVYEHEIRSVRATLESVAQRNTAQATENESVRRWGFVGRKRVDGWGSGRAGARGRLSETTLSDDQRFMEVFSVLFDRASVASHREHRPAESSGRVAAVRGPLAG